MNLNNVKQYIGEKLNSASQAIGYDVANIVMHTIYDETNRIITEQSFNSLGSTADTKNKLQQARSSIRIIEKQNEGKKTFSVQMIGLSFESWSQRQIGLWKLIMSNTSTRYKNTHGR